MADNLSDEVHDGIVVHTISLLRVAAGERAKVLRMLEKLEGQLIADLSTTVGKTPATISKLQALLKQTQGTISQAYDEIAKQQATNMGKVAQAEAVKVANVVNTALKVPLATVGMSPEQLAAVAGKSLISGKYPSEWWKAQDKALQDKFATAMREGMLKGEGIEDLVKRVRGTKAKGYTDGIMQASKAQATALVRTSVLTTANEAKIAAIANNPKLYKGIQWVATLDARTSDICKALDGKQWTVPDLKPVGHDKAFPGPTAHWQCRSTQIPITRSWAELAGPKSKLKTTDGLEGNYQEILKKKLAKAGMDPEAAAAVVGEQKAKLTGDGTSGTVTFEQWLKGKPDEFVEELLGPGKAKLWKNGDITISQLTDQENNPLSLKELHELVGKPEPGPFNEKFPELTTKPAPYFDPDEKAARAAAKKAAAEAAEKEAEREVKQAIREASTPEQLAIAEIAEAQPGLKASEKVAKGKELAQQQAIAKAKADAEAQAAAAIEAKGNLELDARAEEVAANADALLARKAANESLKTATAAEKAAADAKAAKDAADAAAQSEIADILANPTGKTLVAKNLGKLMKAEPTLSPAELLAQAKTMAIADQAKASQAAALSGYKKNVVAGKQPTPAQKKAFDALTPEQQNEFLGKVGAELDAVIEAAEKKAKLLQGYQDNELAGVEPTEAMKDALNTLSAADKAAFLKNLDDALAAQAAKQAQEAAEAAAKKAAEDAAAAEALAKAAEAKQKKQEARAKARKAKAQTPAAVVPLSVPEPSNFPADPNALKVVRKLGGSTGAELVEAPDGTRYVRKRGANPDHVREEVTADAIYRALGANVPEAKLYDTPSGPVKLARFVEDSTTLADFWQTATAAQKAAVKAKLQKNFAADALLGNWDVLGTSRDNVLVTKSGEVWRIDNGGSLRFRAMGAQKLPPQWTEFADEVWTMRGIYDTPDLQALQKNIAPGFQKDFAEFFGDLSIYDIARQVEAMDANALSLAPLEVRTVLEGRLGHLQMIARTSLDFEHGKWKPAVADRVARNEMEMRNRGVVARMVPELKGKAGSPQLVDGNGKLFDELRSTPNYGAAAVNPADPFANAFLGAVISINAHHKKGTGQFANMAKIQAVLALEKTLDDYAYQNIDPAKTALQKHYAPWLEKIKEAQKLHSEGKLVPGVDPLPKFEVGAGAALATAAGNPAAAAPMKPAGSITQDVSAYISSLGGDAAAVAQWMGAQAGSSWSGTAVAMKYFVATSRDIPESHFFWGTGGFAGAKKQFDQLAKTVGGEEKLRTTLTAWTAYTQEILNTTALPNKDDRLRVVRLIRTEDAPVLKDNGITVGKYGGVHTIRKASNESHGHLAISRIHGAEVTVQAVPFSEITAMFLTERPGSAGAAGNGGPGFLGDHENEFAANTSHIPFVYAGKVDGYGTMLNLSHGSAEWKAALAPAKDAGNDATKWMVPLTHIRLKP